MVPSKSNKARFFSIRKKFAKQYKYNPINELILELFFAMFICRLFRLLQIGSEKFKPQDCSEPSPGRGTFTAICSELSGSNNLLPQICDKLSPVGECLFQIAGHLPMLWNIPRNVAAYFPMFLTFLKKIYKFNRLLNLAR